MEYKDPGRYIPIIYLLYSWGSRFGVPSRVPLLSRFDNKPLEQLLNKRIMQLMTDVLSCTVAE